MQQVILILNDEVLKNTRHTLPLFSEYEKNAHDHKLGEVQDDSSS